MILYHISDKRSWSRAINTGSYLPDAYPVDGFIHCSTSSQLLAVAKRFYASRDDLVLLTIDGESVASPIILENLEGGSEQFPHIYGPLNLEAVVKVTAFFQDAAGDFHLPVN
jgi:uncharacterized protein (DUF952 family)